MTSVFGGTGDPQRTIELLWGGPERTRRGPKPRLTVAHITQAAIDIADTDGLAALSMRRVAERLGVTAMSLYTYLPSKSELIDVMVDRVFGEIAMPAEPAGDWRTRLEQVAHQNWELYLRHPWLLQVATGRPVLGPHSIAKYDYELCAVADTGLTLVEMDLVINMIINYVHGAVRGAVEAARATQHTGMTDQQWWETYAPLLTKVLDPARYPTATAVGAAAGAEYGGAVDPARGFEFGLARLLDGVASLIAARRPPAAGQ